MFDGVFRSEVIQIFQMLIELQISLRELNKKIVKTFHAANNFNKFTIYSSGAELWEIELLADTKIKSDLQVEEFWFLKLF